MIAFITSTPTIMTISTILAPSKAIMVLRRDGVTADGGGMLATGGAGGAGGRTRGGLGGGAAGTFSVRERMNVDSSEPAAGDGTGRGDDVPGAATVMVSSATGVGDRRGSCGRDSASCASE